MSRDHDAGSNAANAAAAAASEVSSDSLGSIGDVFGGLANVSGTYDLGKDIYDLANWIWGTDTDQVQAKLDQLINIVKEDFSTLREEISADSKLARMKDIANGMTATVNLLELLPGYSLAAAQRKLSHDFFATQVQTCAEAADAFYTNPFKWKANWLSLPFYSDLWSGDLSPARPDDDLVFSYTYALQQFLRAIYILITAIFSLSTKDLQFFPLYKNKIASYCAKLEDVLGEIVTNGIAGTRIPTWYEVGSFWTYLHDQRYAFWSDWYNSGQPEVYDTGAYWDFIHPSKEWPRGLWPFGAVERYSGANNVSSYYPLVGFPIVFSRFEQSYQHDIYEAYGTPNPTLFIALLQLNVENYKKNLYRHLGLPSVWQAISYLRTRATII